jgi:hypothetical protein
MHIIASRLDRLGPLVVVALLPDLCLVVEFTNSTTPPLDVTREAADLVLLALTEPEGAGTTVDAGIVRLVQAFGGEPRGAHPPTLEAADRCFASLINPFTAETQEFSIDQTIELVARGIAVQVAAGFAAAAARNLDQELRSLQEEAP